MHQRKDLGTKLVSSANLAVATGNLKAVPGSPQIEDPLPSQVSVSTVQLEHELVVYEVSATVQGHTETQRHSVGVGGTNPSQTLLTGEIVLLFLQGWLDQKTQQEKQSSVTTNELQAWIDETRKQRTAYTSAELQAWLDERRQAVADNAAWHAAMEAASSRVA